MFGITMFRGVETTRLNNTEGRQVYLTTHVIYEISKYFTDLIVYVEFFMVYMKNKKHTLHKNAEVFALIIYH